MKRYKKSWWLVFLLLMSLAVLFTACDKEPDPSTETDSTTVADTPAPTEEPTDTPTDPAETEEATDPVTQPDTTAAETEPETVAPTLMTTVDMDGAAALTLSDYFTRSTRCAVELVADEGEGQVLRLSTTDIASVNAGKPLTYLKLEDMVTAMNGILPKTTEYPYLVLKVRTGDLWSRTFGVQGGASIREATANTTLLSARMKDTEEWQYIYFDLTGFENDLTIFLLNFEYGAAKDGESVDIAEFRFVATEEEAVALCGTDAYEIVSQSADDYTLKVMSFNVQTENGTSVDFALRAEMLRDLLDELQPDSIGMQEVTVKWIEWMDSFSFNDSYAGVGEARSAGGEASSIYYRKDKFELVDYGTFWLSETPDVVGSMVENANYPRICTWAHLRDRETGLEYVHVNTHLDHNGDNKAAVGREVRIAQMKVILEFVETLGDLPVVMTGDFNQAQMNSKGNTFPLYEYITGVDSYTTADGVEIRGRFSDARMNAAETVSSDSWASMTTYWQEGSEKYDPTHLPIDYVFYTADHFDAMVYKNLHYQRDGIYMSDHLPQYCELHFKTVATD